MIKIKNDYINFLNKWKNNLPSESVLFDYKKICKNLLYQKEEVVLDVIEILKENISLWAKKHSRIYSYLNKNFISKSDLESKNIWYVDELSDQYGHMRTSGTTSNRFSYLRWEPFLYFIEAENHYDLILDENEIPENFSMVYFFDINKHKKRLEFDNNYILNYKFDNFLESHGKSRNCKTYYVNFEFIKKDPDDFFKNFFNFLNHTKIDVLFISGPDVNLLCHYLNKFNYNNKICDLLSNSYEKILQKDINFLLKNNYVTKICDHMRCWDGGSSFFTCKYGTYHLLDNLCWCEEKNNKLISTDYFSLTSPFINYWNGDLCNIENKYKRCQCGRLYRPFKFIENRPFLLKGNSIQEIKNAIKELKIKIKQIRCYVDNQNETKIDIIYCGQITIEKQTIINNKFKNLKINFINLNQEK